MNQLKVHYLRMPLLCVFLLFLATSTHAQWNVSGVAIPDSESAKHQDDFGAMLLLSSRPEEFLQAWDEDTEAVPIHTNDSVSRGSPIVAFIIFSGCEADARGLCNAVVDFSVLKPDGSEYARFIDKDLWKGKPAEHAAKLQLAADYIGVVIEPSDPLGKYQVHVTVRDLNLNIELVLAAEFVAIE